MSPVIQLALAVGEPAAPPAAGPARGPVPVPLTGAAAVAAAAREAGIAAIRLLDGVAAGHVLDPTVVAAYLAGLHDGLHDGLHAGLGYIAEVPTTHNAPYNTARRVLSLDRATGGLAGVALRAGGSDEVSQATAPGPHAAGPAARWSEYAHVLTRLWESFPRAALIGDQEAGVVVDDALVRPVDHEGAFYRVAGPLDGPSSAQGRPVVVADLGDPDVLDVTAVARSADVVVAGRERAAGADAALTEALRRAGRSRKEVALLGRVEIAGDDLGPGDAATAATLAGELRDWAREHRLDGFELVPTGGADAVIAAIRALTPLLTDTAGSPASPRPLTLRAALSLPDPAAVAA
ncbi:LLM class flavin-dependent oxidoreductase [Microbispora hainanensis]|uniref:LLM class flavin-dependent oxidoreductase n=1 Tax=Microbispora hainanensis TaxID=568844 RepID=A0A544Z286_9ACTN|nr:LLM class flavin-dependent oxidoreductase [Microbispora hainanensis]TQS23169.1 LLM class flavin-dependent oxidoreductase [Microbispora hainanensis]